MTNPTELTSLLPPRSSSAPPCTDYESCVIEVAPAASPTSHDEGVLQMRVGIYKVYEARAERKAAEQRVKVVRFAPEATVAKASGAAAKALESPPSPPSPPKNGPFSVVQLRSESDSSSPSPVSPDETARKERVLIQPDSEMDRQNRRHLIGCLIFSGILIAWGVIYLLKGGS